MPLQRTNANPNCVCIAADRYRLLSGTVARGVAADEAISQTDARCPIIVSIIHQNVRFDIILRFPNQE